MLPSSAAMAGSAVATIVWSTTARNIGSMMDGKTVRRLRPPGVMSGATLEKSARRGNNGLPDIPRLGLRTAGKAIESGLGTPNSIEVTRERNGDESFASNSTRHEAGTGQQFCRHCVHGRGPGRREAVAHAGDAR